LSKSAVSTPCSNLHYKFLASHVTFARSTGWRTSNSDRSRKPIVLLNSSGILFSKIIITAVLLVIAYISCSTLYPSLLEINANYNTDRSHTAVRIVTARTENTNGLLLYNIIVAFDPLQKQIVRSCRVASSPAAPKDKQKFTLKGPSLGLLRSPAHQYLAF
jgi:hypothetical protein